MNIQIVCKRRIVGKWQYRTAKTVQIKLDNLHPHLVYTTNCDVAKAYQLYEFAIDVCKGIDQGRLEAQ